MRTRSQTRSEQPTGLVTLPRAQTPGGLRNFRQASACVNEYNEDGGPSALFADGNFSNSIFYI